MEYFSWSLKDYIKEVLIFGSGNMLIQTCKPENQLIFSHLVAVQVDMA